MDPDVWEFLGLLTFLDPPRPDTKQTIADARAFGVTVKMITGEQQARANRPPSSLTPLDVLASNSL